MYHPQGSSTRASLKVVGTLEWLFLLLAFFWATAVPQSAPHDYVAARILYLMVIYLLGSHVVPVEGDAGYIRNLLGWMIALHVLALLMDLVYIGVILVPVFIHQVNTQGGAFQHVRYIGTLGMTLITLIGAFLVLYLMIRYRNELRR